MQISIATVEDTLELSKQLKAELSVAVAIQLLYISIVTEIGMLKTYLYSHIYCSVIHSSQNRRSLQIFPDTRTLVKRNEKVQEDAWSHLRVESDKVKFMEQRGRWQLPDTTERGKK